MKLAVPFWSDNGCINEISSQEKGNSTELRIHNEYRSTIDQFAKGDVEQRIEASVNVRDKRDHLDILGDSCLFRRDESHTRQNCHPT